MTTQEPEERFKRPGAPLAGQTSVSPIPAENSDKDENVTRDDLEEDMKVFEQEWTAKERQKDVTEHLNVKAQNWTQS